MLIHLLESGLLKQPARQRLPAVPPTPFSFPKAYNALRSPLVVIPRASVISILPGRFCRMALAGDRDRPLAQAGTRAVS